jgi:nicotinate phosphoribosyltransferase
VLSSNLDELHIWQIITQIQGEAPRYGVDPDHLVGRLMYGVGTRLITSWGEPALGGVYKLVAVRDGGEWIPAIKISEAAAKTPNPGHKQVWRVYDVRGKATADLLSLDDEDPREMREVTLHHPTEHNVQRTLGHEDIREIESLLVDVLDEGTLVYDLPSIEEMRDQRKADIERLDPGVKRLINPHIYHVSLTERLWDLKQELIASTLRNNSAQPLDLTSS